jgi:hypothetical protein
VVGDGLPRLLSFGIATSIRWTSSGSSFVSGMRPMAGVMSRSTVSR